MDNFIDVGEDDMIQGGKGEKQFSEGGFVVDVVDFVLDVVFSGR